MPVPVPVYPKQQAHPVIKINHLVQPDSEPSAFQHLTHSLPLPPQGPPPSLASREEWIGSLPSWRRNKPRRIWEDEPARNKDCATLGFDEGLAVADNAAVIKGPPAQASIPPVRADPRFQCQMYPNPDEEMDVELSGHDVVGHGWPSEDDAYAEDYSSADSMDRQPADSPLDVVMDHMFHGAASRRSYSSAGAGRYERGAFTPVQEDLSPDHLQLRSPDPADEAEPGSSPICPATPFADYVDNAFAQAQMSPVADRGRSLGAAQVPSYAIHDDYHAGCYQCHSFETEQSAPQAPVGEAVVAPMATAAYKKLVAPLSEWIANYVWKVCTTGMHLPPEYAQPTAFVKHYSSSPPSHLASSVHSMLLSTLLQPSAIFLALWYIVRLPIFFGPVGLTTEHEKEIRFRAVLLGEAHLGTDREIIEAYAPFRLVLLGCMLANKWLDDHTFSNKTWCSFSIVVSTSWADHPSRHTISNVPIRALNRLEALALDIFQYDLSITPEQWSSWLAELLGYHASLSSPMFPQPISRPSASPHIIVRQALEMLVNAKETDYESDGQRCVALPRPVFVSLDEPKKDMHDCRDASTDDVLEIDLDEDGPLREEYLPKRRHSSKSRHTTGIHARADHGLPPPAKWSPSGDEPILRETARGHGQYVAPQPMPQLTIAPPAPPLPYHHPLDVHRSSWAIGSYSGRPEAIGRSHVFAPTPVFHLPVGGFDYGYGLPSHHGHSRSHSLSYNQAVGEQVSGRVRSYSQSRYDSTFGDHNLSDARYLPPPPVVSQWTSYDRIGFPTSYDRPFAFSNRPSLKA
ncbi:hypothetical protein BD414DRAFT_406181 [Trametes punicea]|nr:hypothetical protein BD414DRAFT_406181 [Trametes punicea]